MLNLLLLYMQFIYLIFSTFNPLPLGICAKIGRERETPNTFSTQNGKITTTTSILCGAAALDKRHQIASKTKPNEKVTTASSVFFLRVW